MSARARSLPLFAPRMIGVFGGTFDPIHYGHLRPVVEVAAALSLSAVRFIPAADPPHRAAPAASAEHRLHMVELAVAAYPAFSVDDRELRRGGPSYTVDTLTSLRAEFGSTPLCLIVGGDAFLGLPRWHRWQEIFALAHIVVMTRPSAGVGAELPSWAQARTVRDTAALHAVAAGYITLCTVTPVALSASEIRRRLAAGESVDGLVPPAVLAYIRAHHLYHSNKEHDAA